MKQTLTNEQGGTYYRVNTEVEAWEIAHELIEGLVYNEEATKRGMGKYWCNPENSYLCVIDLNGRLEVNMANGETRNIWIEPSEAETLRAEVARLTTHNADLEEAMTKQVKLWSAQREEIKNLNAALAGREREILTLKAKLYDLVTAGA